MNAKRNNNKRTNSKRKKFFQAQRSATVLILFIATIVAILVGSFKIMTFDGKVLWTQCRMMRCYSKIESLESTRVYNLEMANTYRMGAESYVHEAEKADAEINHWNEVRSEYVHSNDPVIAWAAKDGFELKIFLISLAVFISFIALVVVAIRFRSKLFLLFLIELIVFNSAMFVIFYILQFLFSRFSKFISLEYNCFNRYRKWNLQLIKERTQKDVKDEAIIHYKGKKKSKRGKIVKVG